VLAIFEVTFPFFALVGAGYFATRRGMLALEAIGALNSFVLFFALPCMLFRFGAATPIAQLLNAPLAITYLLAQAVLVALIIGFTLSARMRWNDAAFGALVTVFPNSGFMGVPLLVALLGQAAAGPVIVTILVDMIVVSSICVALSRLDIPGGARAAAINALQGVARNPMPWSIVLGAVLSFVGLPFGALPKWLAGPIGLLADAASPVALFTIGAVLARSQIQAAADAAQSVPWTDYVPLAFVKLVVHPLLVVAALAAAHQLGMRIDAFAATVAVLVAALPSASNVSLLAERMGANNGRIARIILVSTACAFVSFSAAVALVR
jgi:malonate transporter and related proteins